MVIERAGPADCGSCLEVRVSLHIKRHPPAAQCFMLFAVASRCVASSEARAKLHLAGHGFQATTPLPLGPSAAAEGTRRRAESYLEAVRAVAAIFTPPSLPPRAAPC